MVFRFIGLKTRIWVVRRGLCCVVSFWVHLYATEKLAEVFSSGGGRNSCEQVPETTYCLLDSNEIFILFSYSKLRCL